MKHKITIITFSILLLLVLTTDSFAKKSEKDEVHKKVTKVEQKESTVQKTDSALKNNPTKTGTVIQSTPVDNTDQPRTEYNQTTTSPYSGEQINWQVISSGGTSGSSTNFQLAGTIGQTAVGLGSSLNFQLNSGFWQTFGPQGCCFDIRGNIDNIPNPDVAGVGGIDIADLVYLVAYSFQGGPPPECIEEADVDGTGGAIPIDIADVVYLVAFMFQGGPAPTAC